MNQTSKKEKQKLNTTQKILIGGFAVLIIVAIVAAILIYNSLNKTSVTPASNGNLVVDESNVSDMADQLAQTVEDGMFATTMNTVWHFPDGTSPSSDAYLANSPANHYAITFDILLGEEQEKIYSSPVIPVGSQIDEIILDKDLPAGDYDAICYYHLLRDDGTENSNMGINVILSIAD